MVDIIPLRLDQCAAPSHDVLDHDGEKLFSVRSSTNGNTMAAGETNTWMVEEKKTPGIYSGFWGITESDSTINYKEWEYFHFMEGTAIITNDETGQSWQVDNNVGVIVPSGFRGRWQTTKKILKQFVIIMPEAGLKQNHNPNKLIIMDSKSPDMPTADVEFPPADRLLSAPGTMESTTWNFFHDDNNGLELDCGRWWCKVGKKKTFHEGYWEYCYILRGAATLTNETGQSWSFKKGDGFIVPIDFKGTWETSEELLKEYVIVTGK